MLGIIRQEVIHVFSTSAMEKSAMEKNVDDTFVAATSEDLLQELERVIKSHYKIEVKLTQLVLLD